MPSSLRHAEEALREELSPEAMPLVSFAGTRGRGGSRGGSGDRLAFRTSWSRSWRYSACWTAWRRHARSLPRRLPIFPSPTWPAAPTVPANASESLSTPPSFRETPGRSRSGLPLALRRRRRALSVRFGGAWDMCPSLSWTPRKRCFVEIPGPGWLFPVTAAWPWRPTSGSGQPGTEPAARELRTTSQADFRFILLIDFGSPILVHLCKVLATFSAKSSGP